MVKSAHFVTILATQPPSAPSKYSEAPRQKTILDTPVSQEGIENFTVHMYVVLFYATATSLCFQMNQK